MSFKRPAGRFQVGYGATGERSSEIIGVCENVVDSLYEINPQLFSVSIISRTQLQSLFGTKT
jgi:hypothetical protein